MRKELVFILLLLLSKMSFSQINIETNIGVAVNKNLQTNVNNSYTIEKAASIFTNMQINKPLSKEWFISLGAGYIPKEYIYKGKGSYSVVEQKISNRYLQFNLTASRKIRFNKNIDFFIRAGGFAGYLMAKKWSGVFPNIYNVLNSNTPASSTNSVALSSFSGNLEIDNKIDNRIEVGIRTAIGMSLRMGIHKWLKLTINYDYSITDQEKYYMLNQSTKLNRTLGATCGYEFQLFK